MKTLNITFALIPPDDVKWQLLKNVLGIYQLKYERVTKLGVDTQLQVSVENFARFLEWFGNDYTLCISQKKGLSN